MVTYADPKSKTTDPHSGVTVTQSNKGSGTTIAIIVAAIVVVVGAYMLFFNNTRAPRQWFRRSRRTPRCTLHQTR